MANFGTYIYLTSCWAARGFWEAWKLALCLPQRLAETMNSRCWHCAWVWPSGSIILTKKTCLVQSLPLSYFKSNIETAVPCRLSFELFSTLFLRRFILFSMNRTEKMIVIWAQLVTYIHSYERHVMTACLPLCRITHNSREQHTSSLSVERSTNCLAQCQKKLSYSGLERDTFPTEHNIITAQVPK